MRDKFPVIASSLSRLRAAWLDYRVSVAEMRCARAEKNRTKAILAFVENDTSMTREEKVTFIESKLKVRL